MLRFASCLQQGASSGGACAAESCGVPHQPVTSPTALVAPPCPSPSVGPPVPPSWPGAPMPSRGPCPSLLSRVPSPSLPAVQGPPSFQAGLWSPFSHAVQGPPSLPCQPCRAPPHAIEGAPVPPPPPCCLRAKTIAERAVWGGLWAITRPLASAPVPETQGADLMSPFLSSPPAPFS